MRFHFTDEQEELRRYTRRWLEEHSPPAEVRRIMETEEGFDRDLWKEIATLGWQGMAIPEEHGGHGFSFLELMVLLEEQGRALFPAPFLSTVVLAAGALAEAGSVEQRAEWLPRIASGDLVATIAHTEPNGRWDEGGIRATAERRPGGWVLSGTKSYVLDGHTADLLIVAARAEAGPTLFLVPAETPGLGRRRLETMDMTRKQAEVALDAVRVGDDAVLGEPGAGWDALAAVLRRAAVALAAEQVGGAQRCLEMSVDYAKVRVQFGRPIGSFQAIKHKCADMLVQVESARSAAYYAGWAVAESPGELEVAAHLAKSYCSEAFFRCAAENIQIHGGIGFTWEHDAHLYFKRAKSSELMLGDPAHHRTLLASHLGL